MKKLTPKMTVEQFDNGYWYAAEIRAFAKEIGFSYVSRLRKDELENLIRHYLKTGQKGIAERRPQPGSGCKDNERGLTLSLRVINYADIKETKDFLLTEARKIEPDLKKRSGAQYRLNRWREDQIADGVELTYGDLVKEFIRLNQITGGYPQAPSGRYINFLSDYLSGERTATRENALAAWHELKRLDIPKTYKDWKMYKSKTQALTDGQ